MKSAGFTFRVQPQPQLLLHLLSYSNWQWEMLPTRQISKIGSPSPKSYTKITLKPNSWSDEQELDLEALASGDVHRARAEFLQAINQPSRIERNWFEDTLNWEPIQCISKSTLLPLEDVVSLLCCCGEYIDPIRALFYEHGKTYGLLQFVLATSSDPALLEQVGQLPKNDQVILAQRLGRDTGKDLSEFIEENTYATGISPSLSV